MFSVIDKGHGQGKGVAVNSPPVEGLDPFDRLQSRDRRALQQIFDPQEGVRRQHGVPDDQDAARLIPVAQLPHQVQLGPLRARRIGRIGPVVLGQGIIEIGRHIVVVIMPPGPVLGDPVITAVHSPQLGQLLLDPRRIFHIEGLGIIRMQLPDQIRVRRQLRTGDRDQQKARDQPHGASRPGFFHTDQDQDQNGRRHRRSRRGEHSLVHEYDLHPLCAQVSQVDPVELADSQRIQERHDRKCKPGPPVLFRPAQICRGTKEHGKNDQIAVAVPVAVRPLHEREGQHGRLPVQHQKADAGKSRECDLMTNLHRRGEEEGRRTYQGSAPAKQSRMSPCALRSDDIAPDRRKKISADIKQDLEVVVLTLALSHSGHGRQEDGSTQRNAQSHSPDISAEGDHKIRYAQEESRCLFTAIAGISLSSAGSHPGCIPALLQVQHEKLEEKPDPGKQAGHARNVPVAQDAEADRQHQPPHSPLPQDLVDAEHDQGHHIQAVQPHDVAALRDRVLHEGVAHGQHDHEDRPDPVREPSLQVPAEGRARRRQLQGHRNIKEPVDPFFSKEIEQEIKRRGQIVAEQSEGAAAHHIAEVIGQRPRPPQHVHIIGKEINILDLGVIDGNGLVAEGLHAQGSISDSDQDTYQAKRNAAQ